MCFFNQCCRSELGLLFYRKLITTSFKVLTGWIFPVRECNHINRLFYVYFSVAACPRNIQKDLNAQAKVFLGDRIELFPHVEIPTLLLFRTAIAVVLADSFKKYLSSVLCRQCPWRDPICLRASNRTLVLIFWRFMTHFVKDNHFSF